MVWFFVMIVFIAPSALGQGGIAERRDMITLEPQFLTFNEVKRRGEKMTITCRYPPNMGTAILDNFAIKVERRYNEVGKAEETLLLAEKYEGQSINTPQTKLGVTAVATSNGISISFNADCRETEVVGVRFRCLSTKQKRWAQKTQPQVVEEHQFVGLKAKLDPTEPAQLTVDGSYYVKADTLLTFSCKAATAVVDNPSTALHWKWETSAVKTGPWLVFGGSGSTHTNDDCLVISTSSASIKVVNNPALQCMRYFRCSLHNPADGKQVQGTAADHEVRVAECTDSSQDKDVQLDPTAVALAVLGTVLLLVGTASLMAVWAYRQRQLQEELSQQQVKAEIREASFSGALPAGPKASLPGTPLPASLQPRLSLTNAQPLTATPSGPFFEQDVRKRSAPVDYMPGQAPRGSFQGQGLPRGSFQGQGLPLGSFQGQGLPQGSVQGQGIPPGFMVVQGPPRGSMPGSPSQLRRMSAPASPLPTPGPAAPGVSPVPLDVYQQQRWGQM